MPTFRELKASIEAVYPLDSLYIPHRNVLAEAHDQWGDTCVFHATTKALQMNLQMDFGSHRIPPLSVQYSMDTFRGPGQGELPKVLNHLKRKGAASLADAPYYGRPMRDRPYAADIETHHLTYFRRGFNVTPNWMCNKLRIGRVVVGLEIRNNYWDGNGRRVYKYRPNAKIDGYHAITIVGWCVLADQTRCWVYLNSYGSDWGFRGYGLVEMDPRLFCVTGFMETTGNRNVRKYGNPL